MDWKKADAIRLAYQRCAWALKDADHETSSIEEIQNRADIYRDIAEAAWKQANAND